MKTSPLKYLSSLAIGIFSMVGTIQASLITNSAGLPPAGVYLGPDIHATYGGAALEFLLTLPAHAPFANEVIRTPGGNGSAGTPNDEIDSFGSTLTAMVEVKSNGNSLGVTPIQASGPLGSVKVLTIGRLLSPNGTGTFDTEMLQLNLSGVSPIPFMIRESPTKASTGKTTITDIGGGLFQIDSFFDVFTELSIDGGATWMPSHDGLGNPYAGHVELHPIPEPSSIGLCGLGIAALGFRRRRQ